MRSRNHDLVERYFALSEEWHKGPQALGAVEAGWREVWDRHVAPPAHLETHPDEVAKLCDLGWRLAAVQGDLTLAPERLEPFLTHPARAQSHYAERIQIADYQGISLLYTGREEEAARLYSSVLDAWDSDERTVARLMLRSSVHTYCVKQAPDRIAPPDTVYLVNRLLAMHRLTVLTGDPGSEPFTYGQLAERLLLMFRPAVRRQVLETAWNAWW